MALETALTLLVGKKLIEKLCGPTADYLGNEFANFTQKRLENLKRIFMGASRILDQTGRSTIGSVSPRILRTVCDHGSYVEDELSSEYFSGALASSKVEVSRDDRALTLLHLLSCMSCYEIRTHYICYTLIRQVFRDTKLQVSIANQAHQMSIFIPMTVYTNAMQLSEEENLNDILSHVLAGLQSKQLLSNFHYGKPEFLKEFFSQVSTDGIVCCPTLLGTQLFLMAHGLGVHPNKFCDSSLELATIEGIVLQDGTMPIRKAKG